ARKDVDQCQLVAVCAQAADRADRYVGKLGSTAEHLAREDVRKVYLDERYLDCGEGITQGDAGVSGSSGVQYDVDDAATPAALNLVDALVLGIALECLERRPRQSICH